MCVVHTLYQFLSRKSSFTIKPKAPLMMMMAYNVIEKKTHQKTSLILFFYSLLSVNGIGLFFFFFIQILLRVSCYTLFKEVQKRNLCLRSIYS